MKRIMSICLILFVSIALVGMYGSIDYSYAKSSKGGGKSSVGKGGDRGPGSGNNGRGYGNSSDRGNRGNDKGVGRAGGDRGKGRGGKDSNGYGRGDGKRGGKKDGRYGDSKRGGKSRGKYGDSKRGGKRGKHGDKRGGKRDGHKGHKGHGDCNHGDPGSNEGPTDSVASNDAVSEVEENDGNWPLRFDGEKSDYPGITAKSLFPDNDAWMDPDQTMAGGWPMTQY